MHVIVKQFNVWNVSPTDLSYLPTLKSFKYNIPGNKRNQGYTNYRKPFREKPFLKIKTLNRSYTLNILF